MAITDIAPPDAPENSSRHKQEQPEQEQHENQQQDPHPSQPYTEGSAHEADGAPRKTYGPLYLALTFGSIVPAVFMSICATAHFEGIWRLMCRVPVETLVQVLFIALLPVANIIVAEAIKKNDLRNPIRLGLLQGAAIGTGSIITIASFSAYLFTLTPGGNFNSDNKSIFYIMISLVAFLATMSSGYIALMFRNSKETRAARNKTVLYSAIGVLLAVMSFAASEARSAYIRFAEWQAGSESAVERQQAIETLRSLGTEKDLRMEIADARVGGFSGIFYAMNPSTIRQLYFIVAGKPYQDQYTDIAAMPSEFLSRDIVGENIKGLSLIRSSMTGAVNADSLSSSVNWTFVFKNRTMFNQEARAQVALPPGGVVSGLTLWVNGTPQPAAFAGNDRVKGAYNWVQHSNRDPALVTYLGKERVLLQCAPVPAQGEMKVSLAVAAPIHLQTKDDASLALPKLMSSNFTIATDDHTLRLKAPSQLEIGLEKVRRLTNGGQNLVTGSMKEKDMNGTGLVARLHKLPEFTEMAAYDPLSRSYVIERVKEVVPKVPSNLVVVVDGSLRMQDHAKQVRSVLKTLPKNVNATMLVVASSDVTEPVPLEEGLKQMDRLDFKGGCDNLRAVVKAAEVAGETKDGAVLWIHGPQPSLNNEMYTMAPYVHTPLFYEVALDGADSNTCEFFKNHREIGPFNVVASGPSATADLERYLCRWQPNGKEFASTFTATFDKPSCKILDGKLAKEQVRELIALGANDQCNRLMAQTKYNLAASLASQSQIVSQYTGAVVLERESDYQVWKLKSADSHRATQIQGATNGSLGPQSGDAFATSPSRGSDNNTLSQTELVMGQAPELQGATSGTVGPVGEDATVIMGVNTAGTVRINNLANLEALVNFLATLAEVSLIIIGGTNLVLSVTKGPMKLPFGGLQIGRIERGLLAVGFICLGLLIPGVLNWLLASARDANLFS